MTVTAPVPGEFAWFHDKPIPYTLSAIAEADLACPELEPEAG